MQQRACFFCAVCLAIWMLRPECVFATVVLPADFATVVNESGLIVHGRVTDVTSHLVGPARAIESVVTLAVIRSLKGDVGETVAFRVPNGQVGRYRRILAGAPEFARGDEVVVFLRGRSPQMPTVFGLSQGLYRVTRDAAARPMVMPPRMQTSGRVVRGDPGRVPLSVDIFAQAVRAAMEQPK